MYKCILYICGEYEICDLICILERNFGWTNLCKESHASARGNAEIYQIWFTKDFLSFSKPSECFLFTKLKWFLKWFCISLTNVWLLCDTNIVMELDRSVFVWWFLVHKLDKVITMAGIAYVVPQSRLQIV